jgi:hypothetical protein
MVHRQRHDDLERQNVAPVSFPKAVRLLLLPASVAVLFLGYYLIWSIAPDAPLEEVIRKTRLGLVLTISGAALLALRVYGTSK